MGTIIEGNQIANCAYGVYSATSAKDIVIWNNFFRNVSSGIRFANSSATPVGRLVFIDNMIELATMSGSLAGPGRNLSGSQPFNQVVIRKNMIRDVQAGSGIVSSERGQPVRACFKEASRGQGRARSDATPLPMIGW